MWGFVRCSTLDGDLTRKEQRGRIPSCTADHAALNAAQDTVGFLYREGVGILPKNLGEKESLGIAQNFSPRPFYRSVDKLSTLQN